MASGVICDECSTPGTTEEELVNYMSLVVADPKSARGKRYDFCCVECLIRWGSKYSPPDYSEMLTKSNRPSDPFGGLFGGLFGDS